MLLDYDRYGGSVRVGDEITRYLHTYYVYLVLQIKLKVKRLCIKSANIEYDVMKDIL